MENHPIPQDITGFQFKLIGNMTIKQFGYLGAGVFIAFLFYVAFDSILRFPFVLLSAGLGAGIAFLPIEGRPMDIMLKNFLKALFSSTQFVFEKQGGEIEFPKLQVRKATVQVQGQNVSGEKLKQYLSTLPKKPRNELDEKEMVFFKSLALLGGETNSAPFGSLPVKKPEVKVSTPQVTQRTAAPAPPQQTSSTPRPSEPQQIAQEKQQEEAIKEKLEETKRQEHEARTLQESQTLHTKVLELQKQLEDTMSQRENLENQILSLQKKLDSQKGTPVTPVLAPEEKQTTTVRKLPKSASISAGIPSIPEYPNVLTGIVKDPRGNPVPGILVEVKDLEGNAVRAFKTNGLGHFASATPLQNGDYTIEFEDPNQKHKFEKVGFTAVGDVILPIEIISLDEREELRRELFSTTQS